MGKRKKIIIGLLLIVLVILAAFFAYQKTSENHIIDIQKNLFGIQWPRHSVWLHDDKMDEVIQLVGEPNQTDSADPDRVLLQYNDFQILCTRTSHQTTPYFRTVIITDPCFILWRGNIHIGSARTEVENAFRGFKHELEDYYDLYWRVSFDYDENDCVKAIYLS